MKRFKEIVWGNEPPSIHNLWIQDSTLKAFIDGKWVNIVGNGIINWDDIEDKPAIPSPVTVDSALSSTSTNPVQNKVINSALSGKASSTHTHSANQVNGLATVATSGSYNDLSNKPSIPSAYTLPNASTSSLGGVKQATSVSDLVGTEDTATICNKVNSLLAAMRSAGMLAQ